MLPRTWRIQKIREHLFCKRFVDHGRYQFYFTQLDVFLQLYKQRFTWTKTTIDKCLSFLFYSLPGN